MADKQAAVRDVWQVLVAQLPKVTMPGSDITVGEQLVSSRGKCPLRKYIPGMSKRTHGVAYRRLCVSLTSDAIGYSD